MTITDEYLEINSKDKWTACFCDVEEFYRAPPETALSVE